jgi:hypothetical protein
MLSNSRAHQVANPSIEVKGKRLVIENGAEAEVNAGLAAIGRRSIRDP